MRTQDSALIKLFLPSTVIISPKSSPRKRSNFGDYQISQQTSTRNQPDFSASAKSLSISPQKRKVVLCTDSCQNENSPARTRGFNTTRSKFRCRKNSQSHWRMSTDLVEIIRSRMSNYEKAYLATRLNPLNGPKRCSKNHIICILLYLPKK